MLHSVFHGNSEYPLPDESEFQECSINGVEYLMLKEDLSMHYIGGIGKQLTNTTIVTISRLAEKYNILYLKNQCNSYWENMPWKESRQIAMDNECGKHKNAKRLKTQ